MYQNISISWTNLSLVFKSTLFSKNKVILNKLNGCALFGTLTAVMGTSGAGLTSLLMSLNGMNNSYLSEESKIRLSSVEKIRSTFIGHNEKDFLIMGLTAKQNMIYASKLKNSNCGQDFDHERNVRQVMSDLMISDTMNTKAMNCSGGEQKRLAIALELTALHKPNLIFCDEPTTGLDSNVAEVVIICLKELAEKQRVSIIATIHQPNSDILQLCHNLYVLAKGGLNIYSGSPQNLRRHLEECGITCNQNQVPIETLINIGAKDIDDSNVRQLRDKTTHEVKQRIERELNQTKEKRIENKNKKFYFKDVYILMKRKSIELISYRYRFKAYYLISLTLMATLTSICINPKAKHNDACIYLNQTNNKSCVEMFDKQIETYKNADLFMTTLWLLLIFQCLVTITDKCLTLVVFTNEHQNKWYSSGVYYLTETVCDLFDVTIGGIIYSLIIFYVTEQPNESKRFWPFIYVYLLAVHAIDSYSHLVSIILFKSKQICLVVGLTYAMFNAVLCSFYVPTKDMSDFFDIISNISIIKFAFDSLLIIIYGLDRCPANQLPRILIKLDINDDHLIWDNTLYILIQYLIFRGLAFLSLIMIKNSTFDWIFNQIENKLKKRNPKNQMELKTISRRIDENDGYGNQFEVLEEISVLDNYSEHIIENDSNSGQNIEFITHNSISIAWIDMTLKIEKTFYSDQKLILRGINGFIKFNTLTALMGPSGAGKTSLFKCLNGIYRNLMTNESKIYLSNTRKIMTCFIAQDQREHIINGLTVKQSLIYASKLKNFGKNVVHNIIVNQLMEELAINDIKNNCIDKCSSGQQKRVVMAMELTPEVKPNLIFVDEPTSGVDSYSALLIIKCFKSMAQKHNLSIITAIHQPNLELFRIFDMIYVLAKGGVCIYSGRPQNLRTHLKECQIICSDNQIPIELLLKIGANSYMDETIIKLSERVSQDLILDQQLLPNECQLYPNGIPFKPKSFSIQELWYLFVRMTIQTFRYDWIYFCFQLCVYLIVGSFLIAYFDFDLEAPNSCVPKSLNGCDTSIKTIEENKIVGINVSLIIFLNALLISFALWLSSLSFAKQIKVFFVEYRNHWYSTESFFVVKTVIDLIPLLISIFCFTTIIATKYERADTFSALFLSFSLMSISTQSISQICSIFFMDNGLIVSILLFPLFFTFQGNQGVTVREMGQIFSQIGNLDPCKAGLYHLISHFYGHCPANQMSEVMYKLAIDSDTFDKSLHLLVIQGKHQSTRKDSKDKSTRKYRRV